MSVAFFADEDVIEVAGERLAWLKEQARHAALGRARICLHRNLDEQIQEMVIAFLRDSYVRPHRHVGTRESFHIIEGLLSVVFFDDEGNVTRRLNMGPVGSGRPFLYRLSADLWHTVLPESDEVVIHETTLGPFRRDRTEYPAWAPEDGDPSGITQFAARLAP
jgi:glucose-6-phosphate isomerase